MKYRKKPIVIDAFRWTGDHDQTEDPSWISHAMEQGEVYFNFQDPCNPQMWIRTLEGSMMATPGDFIIRGVKGEIYPCKPEIFNLTYEPVFANREEMHEDDVWGKR